VGVGGSLLLVVAILVVAAPRSSLPWLSLPLNLAPIALIATLATQLGWPIDLMSVQLGSLLFGYVVNSTIYVGTLALASDRSPAALEMAVARAAPAVLGAAFLSAFLFAIPVFSALTSLREAALLGSIALVVAAACDLMILPAMVARGRGAVASPPLPGAANL
jgi:predicted RND superfamily exporter protein